MFYRDNVNVLREPVELAKKITISFLVVGKRRSVIHENVTPWTFRILQRYMMVCDTRKSVVKTMRYFGYMSMKECFMCIVGYIQIFNDKIATTLNFPTLVAYQVHVKQLNCSTIFRRFLIKTERCALEFHLVTR